MNSFIARLIVGFALVAAISANAQPLAPNRSLVFTHVNVVDTTGGPVQADMTVLVSGDHIAGMAKSGMLNIPPHAKVVAARGKYLIPGLWDMHVHMIFGDWLPRAENWCVS